MALNVDAYRLFEIIRRRVASPPVGTVPWHGAELVSLLDRLIRHPSDHRSTYLAFLDGIREILSEREDRIFRRFTDHSVFAEARVLADVAKIRDHLTHVTQVFLIGWIILNGMRIFTRGLPSFRPYGWSDRSKWQEWLNRAWVMAALLHDSAYSVEHAKAGHQHEAAVSGMFGDVYRPTGPGKHAPEKLAELMDDLWNWRTKVTGKRTWRHPQVAKSLQEHCWRMDHGLVTGAHLWQESVPLRGGEQQEFQAAALAVATHNFQYLVNARLPPDDPLNQWFSLDWATEPIGALLQLCDELQEWSRERSDESSTYRTAVAPYGFDATHLVEFETSDAEGIAIELDLERVLRSELWDPDFQARARRLQELRIAESSRRLSKVYTASLAPEFCLHLRARQSVGGQLCRVELLVNWPKARPGELLRLHEQWRQDPSLTHIPRDPDDVSVTVDEHPLMGIHDGIAYVRTERLGQGFRGVVHAFGGAGKSTLLRAIAMGALSPLRVLYLPELPRELFDLGDALPKEPHLLLIDHLDRAVDEDNFVYWMDQLRFVERSDVHIVVASRPDEFDRFARGHLLRSGYRILKWKGRTGITRHVDAKARPRAEDLERMLEGSLPPEFRDDLAGLADVLRTRRYAVCPISQRWLNIRLGSEKLPLIIQGAGGEYRFVHDCFQDLFAAGCLLRHLSADSTYRSNSEGIVRRLETLPRDVPRLLFGLLSRDEDGYFGSREQRLTALNRFGDLCTKYPTTQQWLYDAGRLFQAEKELEELENGILVRASPAARALVHKLLGHSRYASFDPPKLRASSTRAEMDERGYRTFRSWIRAAAAAEEGILNASHEDETRRQFQWFLVFLANHLVYLFTRAWSAEGDLALPKRWVAATRGMLTKSRHAPTLIPGWLHERLAVIESATDISVVEEAFEALDAELGTQREVLSRVEDIHWTDVRRAHLATHIGISFIGHSFHGPPLLSKLQRAREWFERSISRRERNLGYMIRMRERGQNDRLSGEVCSTVAQGQADAAHQYAWVLQCMVVSAQCQATDLRRESFQIMDAHRRLEMAWRRAENYLGPTERLSNVYWSSMSWIAFGRGIESLSHRELATTQDAEEILTKELEKLIDGAPSIAESHPRYTAQDQTPKAMISSYKRQLREPFELLRNLSAAIQ